MKSRTKFELSDAQLAALFAKAGIAGISDIRPLGAGEFNACYAAKGADGKGYALKIAPPPEAEVLPYEKGMMEAELYWYGKMKGIVNIPEIYYADTSCELLPAVWFIMELLDGAAPNQLGLTKEGLAEADAQIIAMCAAIHQIKGEQFGYIQGTQYATWYENIRALTAQLTDWCRQKGHPSKKGNTMLHYIDRYRDILSAVECRMVNYDLWYTNIIAKKENGALTLWWIDPERCFWGDRMADFVCFSFLNTGLKQPQKIYEIYNSFSGDKLTVCKETQVRYAVMLCYMGLIQEAEKYYRYTPRHFGWWRNVVSGNFVFQKGLKILKEYDK